MKRLYEDDAGGTAGFVVMAMCCKRILHLTAPIKFNSFIKFETATEIYDINRAEAVFKYFINPEVDSAAIFWRDGNFNNCGVDNITVRNFTKEGGGIINKW